VRSSFTSKRAGQAILLAVNASAYRRREFIGLGVGGVAAASVGAGVWKGLFDGAAGQAAQRTAATTLDDKVHAYDTKRQHIEMIYDGLALKHTPLVNVDQLAVSRAGELFVCEDVPTAEIHMGVITPNRRVSRFLSVTGRQHVDSELTGVAFNPSGDRMYFSSQRARQTGVIYEVRGPFRTPGRTRA
jgi:secreted PhoX family phosphatase